MPIYEYECESCGTSVEKLELRKEQIPVCCNQSMRRVVSMPAHAVFKGSGFYATEYGSQPQHLDPTAQAFRAQRECKENGLVACNPGTTTEKQKQHLRDIEKYGG